jgi:hypothetical protein
MQGHHVLSELENYTVKGAHHSNLGNLVMFTRMHTAFSIPSVMISKAETPPLFLKIKNKMRIELAKLLTKLS